VPDDEATANTRAQSSVDRDQPPKCGAVSRKFIITLGLTVSTIVRSAIEPVIGDFRQLSVRCSSPGREKQLCKHLIRAKVRSARFAVPKRRPTEFTRMNRAKTPTATNARCGTISSDVSAIPGFATTLGDAAYDRATIRDC
jgi:hypothetical protein